MLKSWCFHLSLNVASLPRALDFYRVLFGMEPAKCHDDYAKFEIVDPPVVFSLVPHAAGSGALRSQVGLRLSSAEQLHQIRSRLIARSIGVASSECGKASYRVVDPDGNAWQISVADDLPDQAPGGTVAIHGMVGDRPFVGVPAFPGIAALVKHVPTPAELTELLCKAGFINVFYATFNEICLAVPGMELREILLQGTRPESVTSAPIRHVMYRGPFAEVTDDDAVTYRRGERVAVSAAGCRNLRAAPIADQFVFFPASGADS